MGWKSDLVFWLADKLDVVLEEYYIPDSQEGWAELIEEEHNLKTGEETLEWLIDMAEYWKLEEELNEEYDSNPVEAIYQLEDKKENFFIWKLPSEWSDQKRDNLFARLVSSFREKYNRDPNANHLLLTEVEKLQDVSRDEMKDLLGFAAEDL